MSSCLFALLLAHYRASCELDWSGFLPTSSGADHFRSCLQIPYCVFFFFFWLAFKILKSYKIRLMFNQLAFQVILRLIPELWLQFCQWVSGHCAAGVSCSRRLNNSGVFAAEIKWKTLGWAFRGHNGFCSGSYTAREGKSFTKMSKMWLFLPQQDGLLPFKVSNYDSLLF